MPYLQNPENYPRSYSKRLLITSALQMTIILFACLTRVEAQCTACPLPTFEPPKSYPLAYFCSSNNQLVVGDFNNDGKPDLAETSGADCQHPVAVYLNDGSGGFGAPIIVESSYYDGSAEAIAVADFNNDGNLDLILAADTLLMILHGDGTGHFRRPSDGSGEIDLQGGAIQGGGPMFSVTVADFNHDNKPDVFIDQIYNVCVLLGNGYTLNPNATFGFAQDGLEGLEVAVADFNGDGNLDVLYGGDGSGRNGGNVYLGDGTGNFVGTGGLTNLPSFPNSWQSHPYVVGDFNGDGKPDVATQTVTVHLGDGTGGFAPGVFYQAGTFQEGYEPWDIGTADINGDGKLDLVTVGADRVFILLGNGDGTFGSLTSFPGVGTHFPTRLAIADFNGDGKPDIAEGGINTDPQLMVFLNSTYQTPVGMNSTVVVNNTTFTFDDVTTGGTTSVTPIDPATVGQVPGGFAVSNSVAYEIATSATFTGSVTLGFKVPGPVSEADFNSLAILHNENGTLVDVTTSTPPRDYANLTLYATTNSFSPFYLARRGPHIKILFDQTKAYKGGSTIPVKLQLLNASNTNVSSSSTSLVARDLRRLSSNTTAPVVDSGNANPDYTFRYDSTLGGAGGGYIFNLSTKGLALGQYVLSFYVGSDHSFFYTVKFEVK